MDRRQIRKIIFFSLAIAFLVFFNRLEIFSPLDGVSFSKEIYDRNGRLLRLNLSSDEQFRMFRALKQIHLDFQKAVLHNEDRYFYYHWGVNPISIFRAFTTIGQSRPYGASTITMQMVRLRDKIYTKNISGKIWQIIKAIQAEFLYSKKQILEAYLNLAPYGANVEGVQAAALIYFNTQALNLTAEQSQLLAQIPQNPVKKKLPQLNQKISQLPFKAPHFVNYVTAQVAGKENSGENNLVIKTSLDLNIQERLEEKLKKYIQTKSSLGVHNGAILLIQKDKKEIKTWIGSNDFFDPSIEGQIDGITTARSPGSALKPFLYGLALDEGLIHPQTLLYDTPSSFGIYDPENFDHSYKGPLSAEQALIQSRNVPAIYLASRLKKKSLYQLLQQTGTELPQNENYYGLAIALGAAEITPLSLGSMYTALSNHGIYSPIQFKISDPKVTKKSNIETEILSAESSFMVLDMLKKNTRSDSPLLDEISKNKFSIAWKTGTSYGYRDAWVAGVIGDHVLIVWLGQFDNSSNPALVGREIAAPLFFEIADLLKGLGYIKDSNWESPVGLKVKSTDVCALTGGFQHGACSHLKKTWFYPGVSPIDDCKVHREFLISKTSGKRICRINNNLNNVNRETFEFWPSDILQLFIKNGLPYKKIPSFEKGCDDFILSQIAQPEIISPKADLSYSVRYEQSKGYEKIPFKVKVDQEIKKIFWFANQKPLGESSPAETLFAELEPGQYEITVVDDRGQVANRNLQIKLIR